MSASQPIAATLEPTNDSKGRLNGLVEAPEARGVDFCLLQSAQNAACLVSNASREKEDWNDQRHNNEYHNQTDEVAKEPPLMSCEVHALS
jgi:hypothetical protein